jgi:hypothetical protein
VAPMYWSISYSSSASHLSRVHAYQACWFFLLDTFSPIALDLAVLFPWLEDLMYSH